MSRPLPVPRFTAIPDQNTTELREHFVPLAAHPADVLGVAVEYVPSRDYQASVEIFRNGDVQLAWYGGLERGTFEPTARWACQGGTMTHEGEILVGVSTCLMGEEVRWDGKHKRDAYLTDTLGRYVRFVPVCPEAEMGMGIPREPIHLEGDPDAPRLLGNITSRDWTRRMSRWSRRKVKDLEQIGLSGYVLKCGSPSCGLKRVPLMPAGGGVERKIGVGLFAAELTRRFPLLPIEEERRLGDPDLRDNFIVRIFAFRRLQHLFRGRYRRDDVVAFHSRQRYLLLAHSPKHCRQLDGLVAVAQDYPAREFRDLYLRGTMEALALRSTRRKNVPVMRRLLGDLRGLIGTAERDDILRTIESYQGGLVPHVVPLALINHHLRMQQVTGLLEQFYLRPAPEELALRNHA